MITKRQAIRNVAADDLSLSNSRIKQEIRKRYGLVVESNEIIGVLGKYADRRFKGKAGQIELELATDYLRQMSGDVRHAVRWLHLAAGKEEGAC